MKALHNRVNRRELKQRILESNEVRMTVSFYKYHPIPNPQLFRDHIYMEWSKVGLLGRIYVAEEGINAQVSIPETKLEAFKDALNEIDFLQNLRLNIAIEDDGKSFFALTIKVREKVVADGLDDPTFNPSNTGAYLDARAVNEMIEKGGATLVDMRNHYEYEVGRFQNAMEVPSETFREQLPKAIELLEGKQEENIIMYCTGGIRCEKATAWMRHNGFKNVFHVEGGIINYAKQAKEQGLESKFLGKNFVFDERLGERITEDVLAHCHQCGAPSDNHINCANDACHLLFIQCDVCASKFEKCCSKKCTDFIQLPEEEQIMLRKTEIFNGTRFGKKRFRMDAEHPGFLV
jgi:UPF0176 protein